MTDRIDPADIRAMMARLGLSQTALADLVDPPVHQSTVARWLDGTFAPHARHAVALRRLIGRPEPSDLVTEGPDGVLRSYDDAIAAWETDDTGSPELAATVLRVLHATRDNLAKSG